MGLYFLNFKVSWKSGNLCSVWLTGHLRAQPTVMSTIYPFHNKDHGVEESFMGKFYWENQSTLRSLLLFRPINYF